MKHSIIGLFIGLFSTSLHGVLLVFFVSNLVQLPSMLNKDDGVAIMRRLEVVIDVFFFVLEIALCIGSILLVLGVKKERPQYVATWIYLTGIFIVAHLLDLMRYSSYIHHHRVDLTIVLKVVPIVLTGAMWYPIFRLWRNFIAARKEQKIKEEAMKTQNSTNRILNDNAEMESPMLYPNLGSEMPTAVNVDQPEKQTLYPSLP